MKEVSTINSQPDFYFYGHSCQDQKGHWYVVEENSYNNTSLISIWSKNLHDNLGIINLEGSGAHDIQFVPEQNAILVGVSNRKTSKPSQLQLIDLKTKKVIHRIFSHSPNSFIDHFQFNDNRVYVGLRNRERTPNNSALLGMCLIKDNKIQPFYIPRELKKDFHKNALSVIADSKNEKIWISTTGSPEKSGQIISWNLRTRQFLSHYPSKESLGINQIDKNTIAVSANEGKILILQDNKLKRELNFSSRINVFGAHLYSPFG